MIPLIWEHEEKQQQQQQWKDKPYPCVSPRIATSLLERVWKPAENSSYPWEGDLTVYLNVTFHCLIFIYNDNILRFNLCKIISKEFQ